MPTAYAAFNEVVFNVPTMLRVWLERPEPTLIVMVYVSVLVRPDDLLIRPLTDLLTAVGALVTHEELVHDRTMMGYKARLIEYQVQAGSASRAGEKPAASRAADGMRVA